MSLSRLVLAPLPLALLGLFAAASACGGNALQFSSDASVAFDAVVLAPSPDARDDAPTCPGCGDSGYVGPNQRDGGSLPDGANARPDGANGSPGPDGGGRTPDSGLPPFILDASIDGATCPMPNNEVCPLGGLCRNGLSCEAPGSIALCSCEEIALGPVGCSTVCAPGPDAGTPDCTAACPGMLLEDDSTCGCTEVLPVNSCLMSQGFCQLGTLCYGGTCASGAVVVSCTCSENGVVTCDDAGCAAEEIPCQLTNGATCPYGDICADGYCSDGVTKEWWYCGPEGVMYGQTTCPDTGDAGWIQGDGAIPQGGVVGNGG